MNDARPGVVCFGEILWDELPQGTFPGGAPFNVAYHLHALGAEVALISAVGRDDRGDELLRRLADWGIATTAIARHPTLPTGRVTASLSPDGDATYRIATGVAWDEIVVDSAVLDRTAAAAGIVFGSLALRTKANRTALDRLLAAAPAAAMRAFDINLRPPYDDLALVCDLARRATLLKLNAAEAARLAPALAEAGTPSATLEARANALAATTGCPRICISAGAQGAGLLAGNRWHWVDAQPVAVRDTVGAGDAFMAGLLASFLLNGDAPDVALTRACRLGEYVAGCDGATPPHPAGGHFGGS